MTQFFNTPVLFLIFNRPDVTQQVFNQIKAVKPHYLYIAADGPRYGRKDDIINCQKTREIINQIDWDCNVKTLFRNQNLGCGKAVSSAITWFFEQIEYGIILEDDCFPDLSFFLYCDVLLKKFKEEEQIMLIGGHNFQQGLKRGEGDYYFSNYPHIWGWATWRRAWKHYDFEMKDLDVFFKLGMGSVFNSQVEIKYWKKKLQKVKNGKINTWDYQWTYSIWQNKGFSITPNYNLVINLGLQNASTHTFLHDSFKENTRLESMSFPMKHPLKVINKIADKETFNNVSGHNFKRLVRLFHENKLITLFHYLVKHS